MHATSRGSLLATSPDAPLIGNGGSALHAQFTRASGADRFSLLYDLTDAGYSDPFGGLSTPGLLNERLTYAHKYAGGLGEIALDFGHQANTGIGIATSTQTSASLRTRRSITKRFAVTASLERRIATSSAGGPALGNTLGTPLPAGFVPPPGAAVAYQPTPSQASTQAAVGVDWRATSALDVSVNRLQTLGGQNDVQPTQTDAQVTYDLGKGGRAYLRERWSAAPMQSFAAATQALTSATGGTHATEIGFARKLGNATSIDTSYLIDHSAIGGDVYATMGVREQLSLGRTKGDAFFQHATATGQNAGGFDLYGLTLSYADPENRFRASGSTQMRTGDGRGRVDQLGGERLDLARLLGVRQHQRRARRRFRQTDERVGLAWRPSRSDTGVTLLQYQRTDGNAGLTNTQSGVLSLEQVLRVRNRTELVGRYAYKIDGDSYYAAHSSLARAAGRSAIGSRLDVGRRGAAARSCAASTARTRRRSRSRAACASATTRALGVGYNMRGDGRSVAVGGRRRGAASTSRSPASSTGCSDGARGDAPRRRDAASRSRMTATLRRRGARARRAPPRCARRRAATAAARSAGVVNTYFAGTRERGCRRNVDHRRRARDRRCGHRDRDRRSAAGDPDARRDDQHDQHVVVRRRQRQRQRRDRRPLPGSTSTSSRTATLATTGGTVAIKGTNANGLINAYTTGSERAAFK